MRLLSVNQDAKTIKGVKYGYLTGILYLAPTKALCPCSSKGCRKACLFSAGHGRFKSVIESRKNKTYMYLHHRDAFIRYLLADIQELVDVSLKKKLKPCVRINGTSDIDVEAVFKEVLDTFPSVQFYDYTKILTRKAVSKNYHLTYSRSEDTTQEAIKNLIESGNNVAVVFGDSLPDTWQGFRVVKGDDSDLRFLDPKGVIVGLTAKGSAKKDTTGFVVKLKEN